MDLLITVAVATAITAAFLWFCARFTGTNGDDNYYLRDDGTR